MTTRRFVNSASAGRRSPALAIGILALATAFSAKQGVLAQSSDPASPEAISELEAGGYSEPPYPANFPMRRFRGPLSGAARFEQAVPYTPQGWTPSPQSGLQMGVVRSSPQGFGYRVLRYQMISPTPAGAARPITLKVSAQYYDGQKLSVEQDGELPQGATETMIEVTVPWFVNWPMLRVDVWVDGKRDANLSVAHGTVTNAVPSCYVLWGNQRSSWMKDVLDALYVNGDWSEWVAPLAEFPAHWTHYSTYDLTVMSGADWIQLVEDHPQRAAALMRWVRTGGTLGLFDADRGPVPTDNGPLAESSTELSETAPAAGATQDAMPPGDGPPWPLPAEIDRALMALQGTPVSAQSDSRSPDDGAADDGGRDAPQADDQARDDRKADDLAARDDAQLIPSRWRPIRVGPQYAQDGVLAMLALDGLDNQEAVEGIAAAAATGAEAIQAVLPTPEFPRGADGAPLPSTTEPWLQARGHGLGLIVAFQARRSLRGISTNVQAQAVEQSLIRLRLNWPKRYGFVPGEGVEEFNNWLLPGVGVAPVGIFQILTTLFVLAIGPLNYLWLKRANQLPLLIATVPVGAAAVTLLMVGYGMFGDGWGVYVRARSVTLLDQAAGEATCWARLSYYAATAPDSTFQLPHDVVLCPLNRDASGKRFGYSGGGGIGQQELVWGERQELARGWLAPRTPTQYLQVFSRPTARRLDVTPSGDQLRVHNGLGVEVRHVFLEDASGRFYAAENLADGQTVSLSSIPQPEWITLLRRPFSDHAPEYPVGAAPPTGRGGYFDHSLLASSLMESALSAISAPTVRRLGPRKFVAVTAQGLELDLGFARAKEDASFHVVKGSW